LEKNKAPRKTKAINREIDEEKFGGKGKQGWEENDQIIMGK
jgi:hypothetical protein